MSVILSHCFFSDIFSAHFYRCVHVYGLYLCLWFCDLPWLAGLYVLVGIYLSVNASDLSLCVCVCVDMYSISPGLPARPSTFPLARRSRESLTEEYSSHITLSRDTTRSIPRVWDPGKIRLLSPFMWDYRATREWPNGHIHFNNSDVPFYPRGDPLNIHWHLH